MSILFPPQMGIRKIEAGVSNPIKGVFTDESAEYLRGRKVKNMFCHSEFPGQKVCDVEGFDWANCEIDDLYEEIIYPQQT